MQRSSRFLCSTASESSTSNITVQTRKRSVTSSAGGDREPRSVDYGSKTKVPSSKCTLRLPPSNQRNLRKPAKSGRVQKPNFRSLQNTIVLAPFHSLKKCFQTKLVDLYSFEKMKNTNHKTQMTKKKNVSFEYDIIELNSSGSRIKKEGKAIKKMKKKSRRANYCQCKKIAMKAEEKISLKNAKQGRKTKRRQQALRLSEHLKTKKRKLNGEMFSPIMLKSELTPVLGGYQPNDRIIFSHGSLSPSAKSSQSKYDSWETYSNSPTCREEHMEGPLAISTTSFDSYLEHFDKEGLDQSHSRRKNRKRGKCQKAVEANSPLKPRANSSRYLIRHGRNKNSNGQIEDFISKEPQTLLISSPKLTQQLQSKTKALVENESADGYNLRSLSSNKEKITQKRNQELHEQRSDRNMFKHKVVQIEVATQVEGNTVEKGSSTSFLKKGQESSSSVCCTSLNISSDKTLEKPPLSSSQKSESSPRAISDMRLPSEDSHLPRMNPLERQVENTESQRSEVGLNILDHLDLASKELMTGLSEPLQDPTHSQQSQGKETDFIFGPKNNATQLGESCEFSFGLNWVFSDDDED